MKSPRVLRILQIITNKIRNISDICGKKKSPSCLADDGSNAFQFSFIEIKKPLQIALPIRPLVSGHRLKKKHKMKSPQILRILQIITNKISDTRDIRGKKTTKLSC